MRKILSAVATLLAVSSAFAADNFTSGSIDLAQAKQKIQAGKLTATPFNQLFICNNTNLPNQSGTTIGVSFPQANSNNSPNPGSCAYLSNTNGAFVTQVIITNAQGSGFFNQNVSSGQMWGVTYNAQTGAYVVAQIQ